MGHQSRLYEIEKREPELVHTKEIAGKEIEYKEGVFWIQKQRQFHSLHYVTPYQASFPPQIPGYFINFYTDEGDTVLDPFCGRGTTNLEARLRGRKNVGVDISPLALEIAKAKLEPVTYEEVDERLKEMNLEEDRREGFEKFKEIYHPFTYSQILSIRDKLTDKPVDRLIRAVILGRLHGHSTGFFSVYTFNVISLKPDSIKKQNEKHDTEPEKRDILPRIRKKAKTVLKDKNDVKTPWELHQADSRDLPVEDNTADLIITSPPFLDKIDYVGDNWLRLWFLGYDQEDRDELREKIVMTSSLDEYKEFLKDSMLEMKRVMKPNKPCIIEVGDVSHGGGKVNLEEIIIELTDEVGFEIDGVLVNHIDSPKISKAFSEESKNKGTNTNRCVIMKK